MAAKPRRVQHDDDIEEAWSCDSCHIKMGGDGSTGNRCNGGEMHGCRKCDFVLCHECATNPNGYSQTMMTPIQLKCSHDMEKRVFRGTRTLFAFAKIEDQLRSLLDKHGIQHNHIGPRY